GRPEGPGRAGAVLGVRLGQLRLPGPDHRPLPDAGLAERGAVRGRGLLGGYGGWAVLAGRAVGAGPPVALRPLPRRAVAVGGVPAGRRGIRRLRRRGGPLAAVHRRATHAARRGAAAGGAVADGAGPGGCALALTARASAADVCRASRQAAERPAPGAA